MNAVDMDRELVLEREVPFPHALVWTALTVPEHPIRWWGPHGFHNENVTMDFRVGRAWTFEMVGPDGTRCPNHSVFNEITPLTRLAFEHGDGQRVWFEASITLLETPRGTRIIVRQVPPSRKCAMKSSRISAPSKAASSTWRTLKCTCGRASSDLNRSAFRPRWSRRRVAVAPFSLASTPRPLSAQRGAAMSFSASAPRARAILFAGIAVLALVTLGAAHAHVSAGRSPDLPFEPVQAELFAVRNSLSNAWGDFDNDGDSDLAVSTGNGEVRLYRNDAGMLVSVGAQMGMPQAGSHELRGLSWGDFDGDGFLDLLGGATAKDKRTLVWHNERGAYFLEVAPAIGLTIPNRSSRQSNWVDFDNDGDLDLYASDRAGENSLYRNDAGHFTHVFAGVGPSDPRPTVGACWFDYDRDGDLDVFLANQAGAADALWRNDDDRFTDVAPSLGLTGPPRTSAEGGVGCAVGDYDNDGHFDLFVTNYGRNQLYRNNGDGTFTDVAKAVGVDVENHAVGSDWGDYDNDGDLDLWVSSYIGASGAQQPHDALFRNDGAAGFVNVLTPDSPLNVADHGVQWVDYDNDGALDLSVTDGYGPVGGHFLFRNILPAVARQRSLSVLVLDAKGHQTRFGAEVRVYDGRGKILASRLVAAGGGYDAQSAKPVHFGLRNANPVTVEVTFMSAHGRRTQRVRNVAPAQRHRETLVIREDSR